MYDVAGIKIGAIAQLGERVLCKHEVVGSIPSGSTIPNIRDEDYQIPPRCAAGGAYDVLDIVKREHARVSAERSTCSRAVVGREPDQSGEGWSSRKRLLAPGLFRLLVFLKYSDDHPSRVSIRISIPPRGWLAGEHRVGIANESDQVT